MKKTPTRPNKFEDPELRDINADLVTNEFIIAQAHMIRALLQHQKNGGEEIALPTGETIKIHAALFITSDKLLRNAALLAGLDFDSLLGSSGPSSD